MARHSRGIALQGAKKGILEKGHGAKSRGCCTKAEINTILESSRVRTDLRWSTAFERLKKTRLYV
jgi:hypothetical protein